MNNIIITDFEGPLDLLLYLIKTNDLDIYNIKIEEITNQYLAYLKTMESLNLDIASEYLTMATELILIKSISLLPTPPVLEVEEPITELKDLQDRLIEYQKYKEVTVKLQASEATRKQYISKLPALLSEYTDGFVKCSGEGADISLLTNAFSDLLERLNDRTPLETKITVKELTIAERRSYIKSQLKINKRLSFEELFSEKSRQQIVITFLTILEMYKKQEIKLIQTHNFDKIFIEAGEHSE